MAFKHITLICTYIYFALKFLISLPRFIGDNSGQSEPLFSSLEEPLLTAVQIDSEHENGTELELTSCNMYHRPDMNVQDSTEVSKSSHFVTESERVKMLYL